MANRDRTRDEKNSGLIWARDDVVVTSAPDRNSVLTYYLKVNETDEIFALGEVEYFVWRQFLHGRSLEAAERTVTETLGSEYESRFRGLVAELAMRGLLHGDIPPELLEQFSSDPRAKHVRLGYQMDPDDRDQVWPLYRFPLFEPNRAFSFLAYWLGFLRHAVWPIIFAAVIGALILLKHSAELSADFPTKKLAAGGIPHLLFMLCTVKLARNVVLATAIRYYQAPIRVFSLDFLFGFWPRFHTDKKGLLRLAREKQLWAHASPSFARLAFFGFGAIGWWWFRGDGTIKSIWFLVLCQAGMLELILATLPVRRGGKNETYYWCCAYFEDPFLRERSIAALRGIFARGPTGIDLDPLERTALIAYALSIIASTTFVIYWVINLFTAWTGHLRGAGLTLFITIGVVVFVWTTMGRLRRHQKEVVAAERREQRRSVRGRRGGPPVASLAEQ